VTPFEVYKTYLSLKNHFTKENYDYFKYCGKTRASIDSFHKRKDRYFFERTSRQKSDDEIKLYFVANFIECDDPNNLWIGEMIQNGEVVYKNWLKKIQTLSYLFKTESEVFINKDNFESLFLIKNNQHPEILKKYLQNAITLETITILDLILDYSKDFDKKLLDPVWETVSLKLKKYKPFLNIDVVKYKKVLKEIVYE
jgi:hypothetical protein